MHFFSVLQILFFFMFFCISTKSHGTVIEFNRNGSTTIHKAIDYLSAHRHSKFKRPYNIKNHSKYDQIIKRKSQKFDVSEHLIKAVIIVESSFKENAISSKGAQGLMQLMPATARRFHVTNAFDPEQNIDGGTRYLQFLLKRYKDDIDLVLAAYNAGEGAVDKYQGIPPYNETLHYVKKVKSNLKKINEL